jgi:hypothetical protein
MDLSKNVLPFSVRSLRVKQAVSTALTKDIDWLFFTNFEFDISSLVTLERLHLPVRLCTESGLLILKMVTKIHENMHGSIMSYTLTKGPRELSACFFESGFKRLADPQ